MVFSKYSFYSSYKLSLEGITELSKTNTATWMQDVDTILLKFSALQDYEVHGCGLKYECYALIENTEQEENWSVYWLQCDIV